MKVATKTATNLTYGEVESVDMTLSEKGIIAATRMFRDQIYTQKEWAVVREIIANAIDEHEKHAIERPVLVTPPTKENLYFKVRDFALGLDKKSVFSVFFQYFESTKDQSNDSIGGFGIGAKSPLAYADMFFVNSFYNGEKTNYVANVNGEASTAHKMDLQNTNETGIEVSVPVKESDIGKFRSMIGEFLRFSKANIEIAGEEIVYEKPEWLVETEFGNIGSSKSLFWSEVAVAIKGIKYKVEDSQEIENPFQKGVVLFIDAEEGIDIHPSRESIEMTQRNIFKINKAIQKLKDTSIEKVLQESEAAKTMTDRFKIKYYSGMFKNTSAFKSAGVVVPEYITAKRVGSYRLTWDSSDYKKTPLNRMVKNLYTSNVEFTPTGMESKDYFLWQKMSEFNESGAILTIPDKPISFNKIIAFCEKKGMRKEVFVLKTKAPENWVEGVDYWEYDESVFSKDEVKSIRTRYGATFSSGSQTGSNRASDIMGYSNQTRKDNAKLSFSELEGEAKVVLIEHSNSEFNKLSRYFKEFTGITPVFYFNSNLKLWKDCKIKHEFFDRIKFLHAAEKYYLNKYIPEVEIDKTANIMILYSESRWKYRNTPFQQKALSQIKSMIDTSNLKDKKREKMFSKALKAVKDLSPFQKELIQMNDSTHRRFPNIQEVVDKITNKIFA